MIRIALALVAALLPLSSLRADEKDDGWTGQWVFPKQLDLPLRDEDGKEIFKLQLEARVTWAGKEWVTVRHSQGSGPYDGYLMKKDLVKLADAPAYFTDRIRADEKSVWAWCNRATAWSLKGEHDNAIKDLTEAIRLDPQSYTYISRGIAWRAKKEFDKAIADYDEAIRLDPKYAHAFTNRGNAWSDKKEFDKAIKDYDEAIRLDPKNSLTFANRGIAWSDKKEFDKAIKDYDEAIRLDPKYAHAFTNRGAAWWSKKEFDKAIKDFDEAIRLDPKDTYAYFNRAVVLLTDRRPKAAEAFQKVIDVEAGAGSLTPYAVILGHLAARQAGDDAAAKHFLKESAEKLKSDWPFPIVRYLRGDLSEAELLKHAVDDDKRTEARCFLGMDLALKGKKDAAIAHFRWVKEHGNPAFVEYGIAVAELERLEKADK